MSENYITTKEACKRLSITRTTLRKWLKQIGLQPYRTPSGHIRFKEDDLLRIMSYEHEKDKV